MFYNGKIQFFFLRLLRRCKNSRRSSTRPALPQMARLAQGDLSNEENCRSPSTCSQILTANKSIEWSKTRFGI